MSPRQNEKELKKYPIMEIDWLDANAQKEWMREQDVDSSLTLCRSIGYLLKETDDTLVLVTALSTETFVSGVQVIPKHMIQSRTNIEPKM